MRQRVNIEDLEQSTKIRAKYLRALENEEFGLLPGPTYVRSFLRTYAEKLGLDPQLLVEEFRAQHEPPEPVEFQPLPSAPRERFRPPRSPRFGPGAAIGAVAVVLVIFLLILGLTGGEDEPEQTVDRGPQQTQEQEKPDKEPAPAAPKRVTLKVIPVDLTYVCVDRGPDEVVFEGTIDGPRTFKDPDMLRINLGKRSAELRVNGEPVTFDVSPEPIGFEFTPNGEPEELPLGERPCA
jgi:hypothetical protein